MKYLANIINAIINLVNNPITELVEYYNINNRAVSTGDSLEEYVKDLFAGTLIENDEQKRLSMISKEFSYLGNASNPPDSMLRNGDAIEVKKMENYSSEIQLNSSYPKNKLLSSSSMISNSCKCAEEWSEKDVLYIVGVVKEKQLLSLFFIYGMDYAANENTYIKVKDKIKKGIQEIPFIELIDTKELGRLNKIDPLGITSLRMRGMWLIKNPWNTFKYVYTIDSKNKFNFISIINTVKYNSFPNIQELEKLSKKNPSLLIDDIQIKSPDNPAELVSAKKIVFTK